MQTPARQPRTFAYILTAISCLFFIAGCGLNEAALDEIINIDIQKPKPETQEKMDDYYEKFYKEVTHRTKSPSKGDSEIKALSALPKDTAGEVNWTAAVVQGLINPKGSLDPNVEEEPPLNLNIFIEAKVPLMANVLFPHSIHTYWLSCNNCHPKIFIPEAGANPISMDEIFKGQWCGRCHGKVAFTFWPRENCIRCHIVLKGQSLEREKWK